MVKAYFVMEGIFDFSIWGIYIPKEKVLPKSDVLFGKRKSGYYYFHRGSPTEFIGVLDSVKENFENLENSSKGYKESNTKQEAIIDLNEIILEQLKGTVSLITQYQRSAERYVKDVDGCIKEAFKEVKNLEVMAKKA